MDVQMHAARAAFDGDLEEALAAFAISRSELRHMLNVNVQEAEVILLERAAPALRPARQWQAPQALGIEDAVDRIPVEMRQEMAHHEGQVIERKAGGAAQDTDDGALLVCGFPGQRVRPAGAVLAILRSPFAPLVNGFGADPKTVGLARP
jgi:hypothetical protein